jgi:general secretion pathway protein B
MSFILDALRKSEHERQRGAVPGISNVPFAAARRETPRWMLALVAALVLAIVALGGAWWHSARVATPTPAVVSVPLDVPAAAAPETRAARVEPVRPPAVATPLAPTTAEAPPSAQAETPRDLPSVVPAPAQTTAREPGSDSPTLPSPSALAAAGIAVPQLHLELHAYSERPAERFVFINGRKYVEGEQLAEGPRLLSIERTGAVLTQQGRRFMLTE